MELRILDWIQTFRTPLGDSLMCLITGIGNVGIIWIVLTCILLLIPKTRKYGMVVLAALVLDMVLCNGILKPLIARARPFTANPSIQLLVSKPADYSFPSGHTAAACRVGALFCRREENLERCTGVSGVDRIFQIVSVCALSDGCARRCSCGMHLRVRRKLDDKENFC